ncbi:Zn-dependent hydrolase [Robiginitalea marina]|uniref:Zn-dependent hydrolase n=1 Tax=Robiginitalea marina TaxID=2954105 RepID=A0ABT1AW36_9FLAO|nr:Zn-dependent hydrolase [Robiginitalea marina]MCO5723840.1 Zn-dependent hydrolase [Robiginitalea marina]
MKHPVLVLLFLLPALLAGQESLKVNAERLNQTLGQLAEFGRDAQGRPNRVAFSDGDLEARAYVVGLMEEAGLQTSIDAAGNIIGRRPGRNPDLKPIAFGSHIDMVPLGGNYDGCVGSMSAIEVARTLEESGTRTRHPLEVIIFTDEEGGLTGSSALAGVLRPSALGVVNSTGYSIGEGIQRLGGDTTRLKEVIRPEGSLAAFLELHIEQGGLLERKGLDIGVVEGIVGLRWWDVTISGMANHAGTTPMRMRQDALLAASRFIQAVNEEALAMEGGQVATVGRIDAYPGAPNVIPGKVLLSLEIRDLSDAVIDTLFDRIQGRADSIAESSGTQFAFTRPYSGKPALTAPWIQEEIRRAATDLGLSHQQMPSGAGHDAQDMALICPVGMIFIPSRGGISHSPEEYSSPEDIANGANVLLKSLLQLDATLAE